LIAAAGPSSVAAVKRGGLLAWLGVLGAGCAARPQLGLAPSLLPNIGLAASVALPLSPEKGSESPWLLEARFTDQFVDDKSLADNGFPEAGNWTQLDLGLMRFTPWEDGHTWSMRFGIVGFDARGEPNLADESGEYLGAYFGMGRFAWFGDLAFGPELTLVAATGPDPRVVIPQITWGVRWMPGPR
jgi:hypothetical protein